MQERTLNPSMLEKVQKLKLAIQGKCQHLPPSRLNQILSKIDPCRRYFIQVTKKPQKFLNIVSAENIISDGTHVISETTLLYGDFIPGRFSNLRGTKNIVLGSMDEQTPAAALKSTFGNRYFPNSSISYTLVIYEP